MIKEIFQAGELKTGLPESGEYIFVEKCPNAYITVRAQTALGVREYIMRERDTNNVPQGEEFTSLAVVNTGEHMGEVIIRTGFGTFTKSNDHQKVSIDTEINLPSAISFATPQPFYPTATALFKTNVQNWPSEYQVVFKGIQKVEVVNAQKVEVTNQKEIQKVEVVKEGNATMSKLNDIVFDGSVKAFQANNNRKGVILVAPSSNRAPVIVLGLFAIEAGGYATVPETAAITVSGQTGDTIKASEAFYPVDFTINNPAIAVSTSTGSTETQAGTETVFATYHPKSGEPAAVTYGDTVSGSSLKLCAFNYRGEVESDTESLDGKWRCQCAWVEGAGGGFWGLFSKVSE